MAVVFRRLETQNNGIVTKHWRTFHCGTTNPKGMFIVVGVDEASMKYIKAHNAELYYGLHQVSVGLRRGADHF